MCVCRSSFDSDFGRSSSLSFLSVFFCFFLSLLLFLFCFCFDCVSDGEKFDVIGTQMGSIFVGVEIEALRTLVNERAH